MIYKIVVPRVGEDVEEIRVLEWHGEPGRRFELGELIVELETHKALVEMRSGQAGWLRAILADVGEWAQLESPIALMSDEAGEALPEDPAAAAILAVDFTVD
ncbi:lipoyl domain-containing protein [Methylocella silvestris]|uniref:2-oxoglutarate dehydrogenase n=1 Tax=Methylocella silvestris TaxID=199596 RepID=A0A2J7TDC7_METSI|nr:lipoyl domain-containing protein [Methylocella silvestris]PNG24749.1 2-oxoglutarate dehydrogenase [Methylocella silvestris]